MFDSRRSEMAKTRSRAAAAPKDAPEFPKKMAKVTLGPGNAPSVDVQTVESSEAESTLTEQGFHVLTDILSEAPKQDYPAWRYKSDGTRHIVNSQAEEDALEGDWSDSPAPEGTAVPVDTDLTRAKTMLGDDFAEKLNTVGDAILGNPRAAKKADGNFDPAKIPVAQGDTAAQADAKVLASKSVEPTRTGRA
jgi:hypothetical protein